MKNLFIFGLILGISTISACKKENDNKPCGCEKDTLIEIKDYKTKYLYHYGSYNNSFKMSPRYFDTKFSSSYNSSYKFFDYHFKIIDNQNTLNEFHFDSIQFSKLNKLTNDGKQPQIDFNKNSIFLILLTSVSQLFCVPNINSALFLNKYQKQFNCNMQNHIGNYGGDFREPTVNFFVFYIIPKIDSTYKIEFGVKEFDPKTENVCDSTIELVQ